MVFGGNCVFSPHFGLHPFNNTEVPPEAIIVCLMGQLILDNPDFSNVSEYPLFPLLCILFHSLVDSLEILHKHKLQVGIHSLVESERRPYDSYRAEHWYIVEKSERRRVGGATCRIEGEGIFT
jgi:hypothetical protein